MSWSLPHALRGAMVLAASAALPMLPLLAPTAQAQPAFAPQQAGPQEPAQVQRFTVKHRNAADLADQVRKLLGPDKGGKVFVSPQANEIVVASTAADRALAASIIAKLDQPVAAQAAPQLVNQALTLQTYNVPPQQREAAMQWAKSFRGAPGERAAWDERTGQLIVFGAPTTQEQLKKLLGVPSDATATAAPANNGQVLRLLTLSPDELHGRMEQLVSRPLPATWDAGRRILSFPVQLGAAKGVNLRVDSVERTVQIEGDRRATAAWRSVIAAMDGANANSSQATRLVSATSSRQPAIRRALSALSGGAPQKDDAGRLVTMLFQPRAEPDAGGQPAAAAPGPNLEAPAGEGEAAPAQPGIPGGTIQPDDLPGGALLGPVQVEFVEGLDIIVLRGADRDVARVLEIIKQIEELSAVTVPAIEVHTLKHVNSEAMATLLDRVYQQVLGPRTGTVSITPLGKPNALLVIGRNENVKMAIDLAIRLDLPVEPTTRFEVFPLRHAVATDAKELIDQLLAEPEDSDDQQTGALNPKAVVIADYRSNSLIVSASPRELEEIRSLVKRIDVGEGAAVDEVRIFPLRNSLAADLATVLQTAISQTGEEAAGEGEASARSASLRFVTIDSESQRRLESGIVTSVRIAADERANSLIISAPADSMDLIAALILQLDRTPDAEAELKVFTIANGDAVALEEMLRTLFNTEEEDIGAGGLGASTSSLVRLQFSVDERTNSIIAAGTAADLDVVYAILTRLDGADTRERVNKVFRLNNAYAVDVAATLTEWLNSQRDAEEAAELAISPTEQIEREVILVAEEASNSLIISATAEYYEQLRNLIRQLDERPPMVMVQVLIAEVRLNDTDEFGFELGLQDSLLFDRSLVDELTTIQTTTQEQTPGGSILTTTTDTIINAPLTPGFNFNDPNIPLGNSASDTALATAGTVASQSLVNFGVGQVNNALGFGGFVLSASSSSVDMLLRALQENRRLEVLSRPQITMLDGQTGEINVGQRVPRIEGVNITQFGQQNSVVYENVGIILSVIPRISPDGQVVMQIGAEKSELGSEAEGVPIFAGEGGAIVRAPVIDQTRAQTTVMAASGQTIVLSGLLTKSTFDIHRRVPVLADIPLLGDLFRYDSVQEERTELLIIMTPRVIRNEADAEMIKQVESSRMSWVLCDVVTMHGPSGLRSRCDDWSDSNVEAIYPSHVPVEGEMSPVPAAPLDQPEPWTPGMLPAPSASNADAPQGVQTAGFRGDQPPRIVPTSGATPINRLPPISH